MQRADASTLAAVLRRSADRLAEAGSPSPRAEGERLAAAALGCTWGALWTRLRSEVDAGAEARLDAFVERRASGEPLAYILSSAVFWGIELEVGPGALVPRPETETLVEVALELLDGRPSPLIVDVGTGSGAVAAALAHERPDASVLATECSEPALAYARRNAGDLGVLVLAGDLLGPLDPELQGRVDVIASNPPYVPEGRWDLLGPDVRFEPAEALFAGPAGDEVLMALVGVAPRWLMSGGALALEVGTPEQAARVLDALSSWDEAGVRDDLTGRPRVVWARTS